MGRGSTALLGTSRENVRKRVFFQYITTKMISITYLYQFLTLLEPPGSFFYPGFQASRNPEMPWNWLILTNFNVWGIFPTQLLSRNLIFNAKFKYSISPGNFQKFSGTLDIAWK